MSYFPIHNPIEGDNVPYVTYFSGPATSSSTHYNHGLFWPQQVASVQQDCGSAFLWDAWVCPISFSNPGYLISDGWGGGHALLWGFAGAVTGNIWNGSGSVSFSGSYAYAVGEWLHAAVGWDGVRIVTYTNGIPDRTTLFAGPRKSPGSTSNGPLFVGGSDHNNIEMKLAMLRGWDKFNPMSGRVNNPFIPERFPTLTYQSSSGTVYTPCDFFCDYTSLSKIALDTSPAGFDSGTGFGKIFHNGTPGNDVPVSGAGQENAYFGTSGALVGATWTGNISGAPPVLVGDNTCPFGQVLGVSPSPIETVRTPLTVPAGAKVFDSFQRANQTFAFQYVPTLGSTEGGSLGALAWQIGAPQIGSSYLGNAANNGLWGILGGKAVGTGTGHVVAWVDTGSATQDIRVTRAAFQSGTPGTDGYVYDSGSTGIAFRVVDKNNYWAASWGPGTAGPQGSGTLIVAKVVAGVITNVQTPTVTIGAHLTLRVTTSGDTITVYHGVDGVPGTWTQIVQFTDANFDTATGAGITTTFGSSQYLGGIARYLNFTAF